VRQHTGDQALEEGLVAQVLVVLLEVLLGGCDELDGGELVASPLEAADDLADEAALNTVRLDSDEAISSISPVHRPNVSPMATHVCSEVMMSFFSCSCLASCVAMR